MKAAKRAHSRVSGDCQRSCRAWPGSDLREALREPALLALAGRHLDEASCAKLGAEQLAREEAH